MTNTEYVICTACMSGGTVESERGTRGGLTMVDHECSECGSTGREWMWSDDTEWTTREGSTVRHVDLTDDEWAEARGTW